MGSLNRSVILDLDDAWLGVASQAAYNSYAGLAGPWRGPALTRSGSAEVSSGQLKPRRGRVGDMVNQPLSRSFGELGTRCLGPRERVANTAFFPAAKAT